MGDTRFPAAVAEKVRDWQTSAPAKRPRNEYEYDFSLSGINVNRREDLVHADRGGDKVGFHLMRDRAAPPAPPLTFLDDHRLRGDQADAPPFLDDHAPAKRPRNGFEYDSSLSGVNANRREDFRYAERGRDRVGVRLLRDRAHSPFPPPTFLDDHRLKSNQDEAHAHHFSDDHLLLTDRAHAPPSSGLTASGGLNFRSDKHRLDPVIGGRRPVDDHHFLPADASSTLFVEGVPSNCTSREAAHIFRHFRGFKEVRIVNKSKEPKKAHRGGERDASDAVVVLCFVEFDNPKCAATAMACVQGYMLDENDRDSPSLTLQFARASNARKRDRNGSSFLRAQINGRDEYRRRR